ncbi:PKD domain-containing protein [Rheinheimera sp. NSM]|uniref:PKD domain-containing protein n=1 Tax=Rheinheimera sp. NSM TaxID=3457884 RepID=UPI0040362650
MAVWCKKVAAVLVAVMLLGGCSSDDDVVANAGEDVSLKERRSVQIKASSAGGEGELTVSWSQVSGPDVVFSAVDTLSPTITAPSVNTDSVAVLRLSVTDAKGQTATDDVTVTLLNNLLPQLSAEPDAIAEKADISLTAPLTDDGEITAVSWQQTAGPTVALTGSDTDTVSFTTPAVTELTSLSFMLTVTDDDDETAELELTVDIAPALVAFTLEGQVSGADFSGAEAVLSGAALPATAVVDANGAFVIEMELDDDLIDSVVAVEVTSVANSRVKYSAVYSGFAVAEVVSVASVKSRPADTQVNVAADGSNTVSVTAVSTALYSLLVSANNGVVPANINDLTFIEKSIDADELAEAAAVVKILTDNPDVALPDGTTDIVALLANISAYNTLVTQIEAQQPGLIEETIAAIVADPALTPPVTADAIAPLYFRTYAAAPGFLSRGGERWQFNEDGTGSHAISRGESTFEWELINGKISIDYITAASSFTSFVGVAVGSAGLTQQQVDWLTADNISQVAVMYYIDSVELSRVAQGQLIDTYRQAGIQRREVVPVQTSQGLVEASDTIEFSSNVLMRKQNSSELAFAAEQMAGTWAINTYYTQNLPFQNGDVTDFYLDPLLFNANGTGLGTATDRTFNWQVTDGQLFLAISDGTAVKLEIIDQSGTDLQVFTTVYNADDNIIAAEAEYAFKTDVNVDASLLVNAEEQYWQTMINSWTKESWDNGRLLFCPGDPDCSDIENVFSPFFGWQLNADNSGNRVISPFPLTDFPPAFNPKVNTPPLSWQLNGDNGMTLFYEPLQQQREWTVLKLEDGLLGRRLYVREESFRDGALIIAGRIGMYEEIDYEYWNDTAPQNVVSSQALKAKSTARKVLKSSKAQSAGI